LLDSLLQEIIGDEESDTDRVQKRISEVLE